MRPITGDIVPTPVVPPVGPDLTGELVIDLATAPRPTEIQAPLPAVDVLGGAGGGGVFDRTVRCGQRLQVPAGRYELATSNPWIDTSQPISVISGQTTRVLLTVQRELRPCRIDPVGPPGAVLPELDIWIGPAGARDRGLVLRSWIPGLEREHPERGSVHWLPVGELVVAVKGRGVVTAEQQFLVGQGYELQDVRIPVQLEAD
jgi:hypothetical protein